MVDCDCIPGSNATRYDTCFAKEKEEQSMLIELYHDLHDSVSISQRLAAFDVTDATLDIDMVVLTGPMLHCTKWV